MPSIKPYKIDVPQSKIDRLHKKLELSDLPDEIDAAEWEYVRTSKNTFPTRIRGKSRSLSFT